MIPAIARTSRYFPVPVPVPPAPEMPAPLLLLFVPVPGWLLPVPPTPVLLLVERSTPLLLVPVSLPRFRLALIPPALGSPAVRASDDPVPDWTGWSFPAYELHPLKSPALPTANIVAADKIANLRIVRSCLKIA
jgi:hypothetical protein